MKQAQIYDKTAKDLRELQPEDMVMIEPFGYGKQWQKATVTKQIGPRSYEVETTKGTKLIRNRKHLRQMKQNTVKNQQKLSQVTGKGMTGVDLPMTRTPSQERKQQQQASSKQTQRSSGRITKMPAYLADYKLC